MSLGRGWGVSLEWDLCRFLGFGMAGGALLEIIAGLLVRHRTTVGPDPISGWGEALTVGFVAGVVLNGVGAAWATLGQLRIVAASVVIGYAVAIVGWSTLGWDGDEGSGTVVRLLMTPGPPVLAAVIAWGPWGARASFAFATIVVLVAGVIRDGLQPDGAASHGDALVLASLLCLIVSPLLAVARDLDRSRTAAIEGAVRHADWLAYRAARTQMHAFLHDQVLATLTSAVRATAEMRPLLAQQAQHAHRLLDELAPSAEAGSTVTVRQLVDQIADSLARVDADAQLRSDLREPDGVLDGEVVGAFLGALDQAMMNSLAHAGAKARRTVSLTADRNGVTLAVIDDGCGFDPSRIPLSRMGVAVSILGRMRSVRGGSATVEAEPGAGTTVRLAWRREQLPETLENEQPAPLWDGSPRSFRLVCVAMATCQLGSGVLLAEDASSRWPSLVIAIMLGVAVAAVGLPGPGRLPPVSTAVAGVTVVALTVCAPIGSISGLIGESDTGCYSGSVLMLLLICLRGRSAAACAVLLIGVLLNVATLGLAGHWPRGVAHLVVHPVTTLSVGAPLILAIGRLQHGAAAARSKELVTSATGAWNDRLRAELRERSDRLRPLVAPLLERIATGAPLDAQDIDRCVIVEGRLRDSFRGERLARPALIDASEAARRRGVDVVLVDDAPTEQLSDEALDVIVGWIVAELAKTTAGRVVVRLNSEAQRGLASVTTSSGTTTFGGWNGLAPGLAIPTLGESSGA